jgi:dCTP diphosphatase
VSDPSIEELQARLRDFAARRNWEKFHTPKNLVMALAGEMGELIEIFQWLTPEEATELMMNEKKSDQVRQELADIFGYLIRLADKLDVDLSNALSQKIRTNEAKYPVEKSRGVATKYTEF